jgi:hypothetical protein
MTRLLIAVDGTIPYHDPNFEFLNQTVRFASELVSGTTASWVFSVTIKSTLGPMLKLRANCGGRSVW